MGAFGYIAGGLLGAAGSALGPIGGMVGSYLGKRLGDAIETEFSAPAHEPIHRPEPPKLEHHHESVSDLGANDDIAAADFLDTISNLLD
jgi:phage tail tape-measure protein